MTKGLTQEENMTFTESHRGTLETIRGFLFSIRGVDYDQEFMTQDTVIGVVMGTVAFVCFLLAVISC